MGISYSVEVDEERSAKAMGRELSVSKKDAVELCRHIKGLPFGDAWDTLRAVADGEEPVPLKKHNSGVGHRSDVDGWDAGRFPKKAAESLLDILYNAEANADNQGYDPDEMVVEHIAAHKVGESRGMKPRAMGRASEWNTDLIDVEVVLLQEDYEAARDKQEETEPEEPGTEEVEETTEEADEEADEEDRLPEELTDVDGVGESKAEALRDAGYETVEDLSEATQDGIAETEGVGKALAARVKADVGGVGVDEEPEEEPEEAEQSEDDTEGTEGAEGEEAETESEEDEETETEPEESEDDTEGSEEAEGEEAETESEEDNTEETEDEGGDN
jgi:large subunit ribosomal protein L22